MWVCAYDFWCLVTPGQKSETPTAAVTNGHETLYMSTGNRIGELGSSGRAAVVLTDESSL